MVVTNDGLKNTRKWLARSGGNAPTGLILGTSGTIASETDAALYSAVDSTEKAFATTPTETDFEIQFEHTLASTEGNGFTFREVALTESITDSIFTRDTFTSINKTTAFEVQTLVTIKLLNEE